MKSDAFARQTCPPVQSTPPRTRSASVSGLQIAVLFGAFTLLISIPIWTHPVPPLSDYVNHLARMQVIATLREESAAGAIL